MSPGAAYQAKFATFEEQLNSNRVNNITQILTILSFLFAISVPLMVLTWTRTGTLIKFAFVGSIIIYISGFLYIGTMKGLGDIFLYLVTGFAILLGKKTLIGDQAINRNAIIASVAALMIAGGIYMVATQMLRAQEFNITESKFMKNLPDTAVGKIFGKDIAYGFYSTISYPSHGYMGLSYDLPLPFEFSRGAGLSQAFESYRLQYLGGENNLYLTYPYRGERATGWPTGMYWSTIFPWLASDVTFYGVPFLMALLGFLFARIWIDCLFNNSVISVAAMSQFVIFIAFIPANNQVLMTRPGLWIVATILALYAGRLLIRR